jgi:FAD/FMN-containing dehydrogenase
MIDPAFTRLRSSLRGSLVLPGDESYDDTRAVWNAAIDRRPAAIARCADAADVQRALEFGRGRGLSVAVRGGGHSFAGKAVCDDGLVIDGTPMKQVRIDRERRLARAGAGCTLGDFDSATQAVGLATTMGTAPPTGISGLTLGGGIGWLMGSFGLACDNLVAAELVTADGRLVRASAEENPDLLWGLRGGGGNFGIVTTFEYQLHPVTTVLGGAITYPVDQAADVLRAYRDVTETAPDELVAFSGILPLATGPAFGVGVCWNGDPAAGEQAIAPLRRVGTPLADTIRLMPYLEIQSLLSPPPIRVSTYARSSFLAELSDGAIDVLAARAAAPSPVMSVFFTEHLHGRATAFGTGDSAFIHRTPGHNFAVLSMWLEPGDAEVAAAHVRSFFADMSPFLAEDVYSNYLGDEGNARVRSAYGTAWERLVQLKRKFDPQNVFRLNQNVSPSG